jgi:hypothetical protein
MRKTFYSIIILFISAFTLAAETKTNLTGEQLLGEELFKELQNKMVLSYETFHNGKTEYKQLIDSQYLPDKSFIHVKQPYLTIDKLYYIPNEKLNSNFQEIFTNLHKIQTMKGIQYYSASKKKMRVLFEDAYTVNSTEKRKKINDLTDIKKTNTFAVYQKDNSFGKMYYNARTSISENTIHLNFISASSLKLGIIKLIGKENLQISASIYRVDGGIIFYGCLKADFNDILGIVKKKSDSMHNRLQAVFDWFKNENCKPVNLTIF